MNLLIAFEHWAIGRTPAVGLSIAKAQTTLHGFAGWPSLQQIYSILPPTDLSKTSWRVEMLQTNPLRRQQVRWMWFSTDKSRASLQHAGQGRRLRFASGGIIMASAASLKIFFSRGDNTLRKSKTNNAGIKVGGSIPSSPRCRRLWCWRLAADMLWANPLRRQQICSKSPASP
jgi:hypothetical protein